MITTHPTFTLEENKQKEKKSKLFAFFSSLHLMKKKTSLHCIDLNKEGRCPYFPQEFCLSVFPSEKNRKRKRDFGGNISTEKKIAGIYFSLFK